MLFNVRTPPSLTGRYYRDIPRLYDWCVTLAKNLSSMFSRIEDKQIVSVSADKITAGVIKLESGGSVEIGADKFVLSNSDGSQYIKLEGNNLVIKATVEA